jgi:hypothetical protein
MQYSCDRAITVAAMGQHMNRSGWPSEYWPPFARSVDSAGQHLTKAGAQLWIRHLISLEAAQSTGQAATSPTAEKAGGQKPFGYLHEASGSFIYQSAIDGPYGSMTDISKMRPLYDRAPAADAGGQAATTASASEDCKACGGTRWFDDPHDIEHGQIRCQNCIDSAPAPSREAALNLSGLKLHYMEGVENGGYYLATDVIRLNGRAAQAAHAGAEELISAVRKLVKAKGRFHTEQNYKALIDALDKYDAAPATNKGKP